MNLSTHRASTFAATPRALALFVLFALTACSNQGLVHAGTGDFALRSNDYLVEFKKIDTGGTGKITLDQAVGYYAALFLRLDPGHRGYLTVDDLRTVAPMMGARTAEELFSRLDNNGDGRITQSEFIIAANWLFQRARTSPTVLTIDDVNAAAVSHEDQAGLAGNGGHRGGGARPEQGGNSGI